MTEFGKNHHLLPWQANQEKIMKMRAWHVSTRYIIAATTSEMALSYARSIGLDEQDGLFAAASELSEDELMGACWTGYNAKTFRQDTIGNFLAETTEPQLLCEFLLSHPG